MWFTRGNCESLLFSFIFGIVVKYAQILYTDFSSGSYYFPYKQLKESILEGTHPHAAFLKEKSGLRFERQCDHSKPIGDGNSGAVEQRADENTVHGQAEAPKGNLNPPTAENVNKLLPEDTTNMISLPCKRAPDGLAVGNLMGPSNENVDGGDFHADAKRLKHDDLCSTTSIQVNSVSLHGKKLLEDSFQPSTDGVNLAKESQLGELERSTMVSEDDFANCVVLEGVEQITEVECEEFEQIPFHTNKMPQELSKDESHHDTSIDEVKEDNEHWAEPNKSIGTASDGGQQRIAVVEAKDDGEHLVEHNKSSGPSDEIQKKTSIDETEDDGNHCFQPKASNYIIPAEVHHTIIADEAIDDTQHCCEEERLSDRSEYHDEEDGIALEKQNFMSSQFTFNHDSLSVAGWTEQNLCMKCNKDGQLLVCSSSGCPLVVHEYCLGCPASYDNLGNFYCPFCAYSRAISAYLESKKKASLAKKELALFINAGTKHEPGKPKKKHGKRKDDKLNEGPNLVKVHEKGHVQENRRTQANNGNTQITDQQIRRTIAKQEAKYSTLCVTHNLLGEEEATPICRTLDVSPKEQQGTEDMGKECLSKPGMDGQQNQSLAEDNYDGVEDQGLARVGVQQEGLPQQISDPPEDPASLNNDAEGTSGDENDKPSGSNYHIRLRKHHHQ